VEPADADQHGITEHSEEPVADPAEEAGDSERFEDDSGESADYERPALPFLVVGIGASAGGLEALESLFECMPVETGVAFVVLQHLSPDFESHMDELLARKTRMPVRQVTDGVAVEPNHIYLIPPRKEMIISGGKLLLTDKEPNRGLSLPIDVFFRSLAADQGTHAMAIVLSGTGSDGSRGARDVHKAGGIVVCQSEATAKFDGMPRAAEQTGVVDLVLAPDAMPAAILHYAERLAQGLPMGLSDPDREGLRANGLQRIFDLLRDRCGIDFAYYKPTTVIRRIERRLKMGESVSVEDYATLLERDQGELEALYQDLLIGVTRFFRDKDAFDVLGDQVLPNILQRCSPREEIRIWCAGCATGEEAYSLAILLHERLSAAGRPPNVRVFATDVHRSSLEFASRGVYTEESLTELAPDRRERYFMKRDKEYQISKEIRQMVVFAPHNILRDAPFTRLDLLTCRNLLIYLQPSAQKKALSLFHFALKTGGFLLLGSSETPGELSEEFEPIDKQWRVYRKRRDVQLSATLRIPYATGPKLHARGFPLAFAPSFSDRAVLSLYDQMLARYMPPGVLIDDQYNVLHTFPGAEKLLRVPSGRPSSNVLDLVLPSLRPVINGALQHVQKVGKRVSYSGVPVKDGSGGEAQYRVQIESINDERTKTNAYLLTLEDITDEVTSDPGEAIELNQGAEERLGNLETELRFTKESLQATIEELEASNEELQATNEELVSSNEELQSTNEELHSVNEELYTVNSELQQKIAALTETTADLDSVLKTTEVGVLFLDSELRVRRFTPKIVDEFRLLPQDEGRPISVFTHRLDYPDFLKDVQACLERSTSFEKEVEGLEGGAQFIRIFPYVKGGKPSGVVVTLLDLTPLRNAESGSRMLAAVAASSADAIIATDIEGRVVAWNEGATRMYGYSREEIAEQPLERLVPGTHRWEMHSVMRRALAGEQVQYFETARQRKDGTLVHVSLQVSPILGPGHRVHGVSTIERDISPRIAAEEEIRQAVRDRERFLAILSHELRNPLAAVLSAARVFGNDRTAPDVRARAAHVIERQSHHMARLLDDLLDVSRIREGNFTISKAPVDLCKVAESAIETVAGGFAEKGVTLDVQLGPDPVMTVGDSHRVRQLIVNLLTNALRHTPAGKRVEFSLTQSQERAMVRVRDEGDGMPAEVIRRIFDPFVTTNGASRSGGLGIGLWLVRSIAEAHGGNAQAVSAGQGYGSEFLVELPVLEMDQSFPREAGPEVPPARVLVVEDHDDLRELMQSLLEAEGFTVTTADSGEEGLRQIARFSPDLAVVDIGLPGMSGIEFARQLRGEFGAKLPRLIALTGFGQESDVQAIRDAGFHRHMVKPVDIDALQDAIREELLSSLPEGGRGGVSESAPA
jgi:two-component system CheB/CheR fusion protein